jgi:CRISPR-associated exonuclease Cas4
MSKEVISASEMERYGYCPLSWWLGRTGVDAEGSEVASGLEKHQEIGASLKTLLQEEHKSRETSSTLLTVVTYIGILVLAALFILWRIGSNEGNIIIIVSLFFMLGASFLLYRLLQSTERVDKLRDDYKLGEGEIEAPDDLTAKSPVLKADKLNLVGRPDYILYEDGVRIPVEVKTGRRPQAPFFSHVLQAGAYCLLVEEMYGKAPPSGQLRYGLETEPHTIEWEPKLKAIVLEKLEEMNDALMGRSEVHRNHNRPGKCQNCSRRRGCPERLDKPPAGGNT